MTPSQIATATHSILTEAVSRIPELTTLGFSVTVDVLGKVISSLHQADHTAQQYRQVIDANHHPGLDAKNSVKPSALGLLMDTQSCEQRIEPLVEYAAQFNTGVCMDMEDVRCTQREINRYGTLSTRHRNVGFALQACLRRPYQDIKPFLGEGHTLRVARESTGRITCTSWTMH